CADNTAGPPCGNVGRCQLLSLFLLKLTFTNLSLVANGKLFFSSDFFGFSFYLSKEEISLLFYFLYFFF
ncbi:hypothetical protein, partial [Arcobacter sp. CECT 8989]|uniref:hypothetical protein n=1 Tax=Arcobacter sp. CECT 8989 TaxID=2044509 RepID=UPI002159C69C